ncbi:MAG: protein kinase domain-containing protein [Acidobacteriota bacterium]
MASDKPTLLALAEAVADETPVEWGDLGPEDGRVAGLRQIQAVSAAFRAAARERPASPAGSGPALDVLFEWGHLRVLERLAGGSFGDVYRAWDEILERVVALKLWRHAEAPGAGGRRLLMEARLLARVRHPNVVTVHGAEVHDGRAGLWTDLVEGRTLEDWIDQEGPRGAQEAALIGIDLCRALAAVHAAGLVHGDIKTANVMRELGGRIVLMDFGAGLATETSALGAAFGTPLAMAPEVLRGEPPGPAGDLYSLGVLLYRLVTGCHPVVADDIPGLLTAHERGERVPLADRRPDLPAAFLEAVERTLAPAPGDRWASAGALERALARSLPDSARSSTSVRPISSSHTWRTALLPAGLAAALVVLMYVVTAPPRTSPPPAQVRSLAVLPFEPGDSASREAFLGPSLSDGLTQRLERLSALRMVPGAKVTRWVPGHPDAQTIGRSLEVPAFIDGAVRFDGDRLRLAVEMVSTRDGSVMWSTDVTGPAAQQGDLEDTVARRLAKVLRIPDSPDTEAALHWRPPIGIEAHRALLAGAYYGSILTPESLTRAVESFERAIRHEPSLAAAHAGLARTWARFATIESSRQSPQQAWVRARREALRALDLDPGIASAHTTLGAVAFRCDWAWAAAERDFRSAISLAPDDADAHRQLAELLSVVQRHEEAILAIRRAVELEPESAPIRTAAGTIFLEAGHFDEAIPQVRAGLAIDPSYHPAYVVLGSIYEEKGQIEEAVAQWLNGLTVAGASPNETTTLGQAYQSFGMAGVWRWRLARLEEQAAKGYVSPALVARAHAGLGHQEEAMRWLTRAVEERDDRFLDIKEEPAFDELRLDPRFGSLRDRLHFETSLTPDRMATERVGTAPAVHPLKVEAALYRTGEGRAEALANGASVSPGDHLFLALTCSEPIHLYVINEDRLGSLFVLFPLPGLDLTNPLPARQRHRVPGRRDGVGQDWLVTSAGGREAILVVASRRALPELERELFGARVADAGRAVQRTEPPSRPVVALRGVGGLAANTPAPSIGIPGRLTQLAGRLAEQAARGDAWLREFILENGGQ